MNAPSVIIAISGLMGSGKTTLARGLADAFEWRYIPEAPPAKRYLGDLFEDPTRWAFEAQLAFLSHKAIQLQNAVANREHVVLDRSLAEDWHIFARHFHDTGHIEDRAYHTYVSVAEHFVAALPPPSLYILCQCSVPIALSRIKQRGRAYQKLYPPGHLHAIDSLYHDWVAGVESPVYRADSEASDWREPATRDKSCEFDRLLYFPSFLTPTSFLEHLWFIVTGKDSFCGKMESSGQTYWRCLQRE